MTTCFEHLEREYAVILGAETELILKLELCALASLDVADTLEPRGALLPIGASGAWYRRSLIRFATALRDEVEAGRLRPNNTEMTASLFLAAVFSLMVKRALAPAKEPVEVEVSGLMDVLVNGLAW